MIVSAYSFRNTKTTYECDSRISNIVYGSRNANFCDNVKQREMMMFVRIATHLPVFALSIALILSFDCEKIVKCKGLKGPLAISV